MELEPFLSGTRWEILKLISDRPQSPFEISAKLKTTLANVSSQLRLLSAAGLVSTTKLPQRDKGKPRVVYSIASDFGYLVLLSSPFAQKKLVRLSPKQKIVLRIWNLEDSRHHELLESFFWKIEPYFEKISCFYMDLHGKDVVVVCDSKEIKSRFDKTNLDDLKIKIISSAENKGRASSYLYFFLREEDGVSK